MVDDNSSIREDFRKIFSLSGASREGKIEALEASLFETHRAAASQASPPPFLVDFASQGREGFDAVRRMVACRTPYALAFVDMRMPPGWDGVETSVRIWEADPAMHIVICSAYSDYSWNDVVRRLNRPDLRLLLKPFETKDVLELAWSLTNKWLSQPAPRVR